MALVGEILRGSAPPRAHVRVSAPRAQGRGPGGRVPGGRVRTGGRCLPQRAAASGHGGAARQDRRLEHKKTPTCSTTSTSSRLNVFIFVGLLLIVYMIILVDMLITVYFFITGYAI
jgi:hypothetical protein